MLTTSGRNSVLAKPALPKGGARLDDRQATSNAQSGAVNRVARIVWAVRAICALRTRGLPFPISVAKPQKDTLRFQNMAGPNASIAPYALKFTDFIDVSRQPFGSLFMVDKT